MARKQSRDGSWLRYNSVKFRMNKSFVFFFLKSVSNTVAAHRPTIVGLNFKKIIKN